MQPLFISILILYFNNWIQRKKAVTYAVIISMSALAGCFLNHLYFFNVWRIGMRIRLAVSGLIYRKVKSKKIHSLSHSTYKLFNRIYFSKLFKMNSKSLNSRCTSEVISLLSIESTHMEISVLYLPYINSKDPFNCWLWQLFYGHGTESFIFWADSVCSCLWFLFKSSFQKHTEHTSKRTTSVANLVFNFKMFQMQNSLKN